MISTVYADPTTPSYTITDLGPGNITFSTDASGNGIVIAPGGQTAYPFQQTHDTVLTPDQGTMVSFPLAQSAPVNDSMTYGDPRNAYSVALNPIMNTNRIVAAIDSVGVSGHYGSDIVYYVPRNPNGSWGSPGVMWGGAEQFEQGPVFRGVSLTGINKLNQVLGSMQPETFNNPSMQAVLYDIGTHSLINLSNYLMSQSQYPYHDISPIALDDQGRILLRTGYGWSADHTVLLTPDGVSSDPLPLATPEPGSLAVMALAMAALAAQRVRQHRR
jgi:hypothetical protein